GESTPRAEVVALARRIRARGMVANLTTSGFQLDDAAAATAAALFGQVNVSLDGVDDAAYRGVRGWSGAGLGLRAIDRLVAAGARVGVNTVITRSNVDALPALGRALADRGITDWQWLRLKPVGRAAADYAERTPTADQLRALWPTALAIEADTGLPIRWDCAMVPFLAAHGLPVEALRALAVTGCPAGQSLLARTAGGGWTPCSFAHDAAEAGPVDAVWAAGGALTRWRGRVATLSAASGGPTLAEPCASCPYAEVCRGGCRVVAAFHGDPGAPGPECPRVVAFRVQGPAVERPAVGPGVTG
ncbi:MAG: radical SAM protein, partial [Myxococcota bacterium]